jgi:uncharacterized membrane protein (DUF4010 family)
MNAYESLFTLAVVLGLGLIIGLEREQTVQNEGSQKHALGGARTFPLIALLGACAMLLERSVGAWVIAVVLAGLFALVIAAYTDDLKHERDRGLTTEAAFVLTFLLGALAESDELIEPLTVRLEIVSAIGIGTAALLSVKAPLHGFVKKVSRDDLYATLKFLVVLVIALPLLPDKPAGPLGALNPFQIGLMVAVIAGIGFAGYVLVRVLGPGRGLGLTGLVGGLVSSTAVTLSMAARARRDPSAQTGCALAVLLASAIMCVRITILVAVANPALLGEVIAPIGGMLLGGLTMSGYTYLKSRSQPAASEDVRFTNPFELSSALKFGAVFAAILVISKAANQYLGQRGEYLAGIAAGTTDVDAITLSTAKLSAEGMSREVAATTIILAAASNTVVKSAMAFIIGGHDFGRRVVIGSSAMLIGGAIGLVVLWA